jgi:hypothetical protein
MHCIKITAVCSSLERTVRQIAFIMQGVNLYVTHRNTHACRYLCLYSTVRRNTAWVQLCLQSVTINHLQHRKHKLVLKSKFILQFITEIE